MPDYSPFIRTILSNPSATGPRLVLADKMEDNGDYTHADFIRVACALAVLRCRCANPLVRTCRKCRALWERALELIDTEAMRAVLADPAWLVCHKLLTEPPGVGATTLHRVEWLDMSLRERALALQEIQDLAFPRP
jgi:uncharacterized protein (TIGR02996 family)